MERIRSGPSDQVDGSTGCIASAGVGYKEADLYRLYGVLEGTESRQAAGVLHVGYAVEQIFVGLGVASAEREVAGRGVIEGAGLDDRVLLLLRPLRRTISFAKESGERPLSGEILHLTCGHYLTGGRRGHFDQRGIGGDAHFPEFGRLLIAADLPVPSLRWYSLMPSCTAKFPKPGRRTGRDGVCSRQKKGNGVGFGAVGSASRLLRRCPYRQ